MALTGVILTIKGPSGTHCCACVLTIIRRLVVFLARRMEKGWKVGRGSGGVFFGGGGRA